MSHQIAYANLLDTTRYFKVQSLFILFRLPDCVQTKSHAYSIKIEEQVQDYPITIEAKRGYPVTYFDLDELKKDELPEIHI